MTQQFENWDPKEREQVLVSRKPIVLLAKRETLQFEGIEQIIENVDKGHPFLLTPPVIDRNKVSEIIFNAHHDIKEKWLRTYLMVYCLDGKIVFKKIDANSFEAAISF